MHFLEKPYVIIPILLTVTFGIFFNVVFNDEEKEHAQSEQPKETEVSFNGEEIYQKSCIGCHGDAYQGSVGPALTGLDATYSKEDIADILKNGKGTGMPAGLVSGEEEKMTEWLMTLK